MKSFLIKYQFKEGTPEAWHAEVSRFIAALDSDPELKGRIAYRCMKEKNGLGYYHLATTLDDEAPAALQRKAFFGPYTEETRRVAGGTVEVVPLEVIAETSFRG
jgi:hypothetical protein